MILNFLSGLILIIVWALFYEMWEAIDSEFNKKVIEPLKNKYPKHEKTIIICKQIIDVIVIIIVMYCIGDIFNNHLIV